MTFKGFGADHLATEGNVILAISSWHRTRRFTNGDGDVTMNTAQRRSAVAGVLRGSGMLLLGGGLLMLRAAPAYAVVSPDLGPGVTVNGTGSASGTPDELLLSLDVDTQASSVATALNTANQDMNRVRNALHANGVAASDVQTSGLSVQADYGQQGNITGYQVTESLTAVLHNLPGAGGTITAAVNAGGNAVRIDAVSLDISDKSALLAKARANAMADAKLRASQYAAGAGRKLGPVITISEVSSNPLPIPLPGAMFNGAGARSPVPVAAGTLKVTVTVTVTYALA